MSVRMRGARCRRSARLVLRIMMMAALFAAIDRLAIEVNDATAQTPPVTITDPKDGKTVAIDSPSLLPARFGVTACDADAKERITFTAEVTPGTAGTAAMEGDPVDEAKLKSICFQQAMTVATASDADFTVTITTTDKAGNSAKTKVNFKVNHLFIWKGAMSLAWDDFTAIPPAKKVPEDPKDPASYDAVTDSYIDHHLRTADKLAFEKEGSKWNCVAAWEVGARAIFRSSYSWVRADKKSAELLDHEQGHFNITKIYADKLDALLKKTVAGKDGKGSALNAKLACGKALKDLYDHVTEKQLNDIVKKYVTAWSAKEQDYDNETKHGSEAADQKTWDDEIAKALSGAQSAKFPDP